jgi:intein/homing endonuclease
VDGEIISATGEHPFWTADKGWVEAADLIVGSLLQTADGRIVDVDRVEKRFGKFEVYNFNVEGIPTYFVSDLGILVHNVCDPNRKPAPFLPDDPYSPESVANRQREGQDYYGNVFDPQAVAKELGYTTRIPAQKAPFDSHGQTVFSNGKNYISRDIDSHNVTNGWKMFNKKGERIGTYSSDLTTRLKD